MEHAACEKSDKLLIVVSDRQELADVGRAGARKVCRWFDSPEMTGAADGRFDGDPTDSGTFAWASDAQSVSAVIDVVDDGRAACVLEAIRAVRPDAAVLVLADGIRHARGDGTLARAGDLRDVVRLDLDEELERLEAERRVHCLREFVGDEEVVPIVLHPDPDPDAISSAFALRTILRRKPDSLPIVTPRSVSRPENRRMIELLRLQITEMEPQELRGFERIITVDAQPTVLMGDGRSFERSRFAVLDHHPVERGYAADILDVRPDHGATATMMTEYLRADGSMKVGAALATALLYGIKTDTDGLMRGVVAADVEAYAYLQGLADLTLLRRLERPSYAIESARTYGAAIAGLRRDNDTAAVFAGTLEPDQQHVLADLGDFCLGIEGVTWVVSAARIGEELVIGLRHAGPGPGAGDFARAVAKQGGRGGGHATMARVALPTALMKEWVGDGEGDSGTLLARAVATIEELDG